MKFIQKPKLTIFISLFLLAHVSTLNLKALTSQPAVSPSGFVKPLLSTGLTFDNHSTKMTLNTFLEKIKFSLFNLSRGEATAIFSFADKTHQDIITTGDWNEFVNVFVLPFEQCDPNHKYLLSLEEIKKCFEKESTSLFIQVRPHQKDKMFDTIVDYLGYTHNQKEINIYSYILLRKAMYAWKKCSSDQYFMTFTAFKCAIGNIGPYTYIHREVLENIYQYAIDRIANDLSIVQMDFLTFVKTSFYINAFSLFGANRETFTLNKRTFVQTAVKEDILPSNFDEREINYIFKLTATNGDRETEQYINFETFAFFYNINRLFNIYSKERPALISVAEAKEALKSTLCPIKTVIAIDKSITNCEENEYRNSTAHEGSVNRREDSFYFSFKQDGTERTGAFDKKGIVYPVQPNEANRQVFFEIFTGKNMGYLTKEEFYRAFSTAEMFTHYLSKGSWTVGISTLVSNLYKDYENLTPKVGIQYRNGFTIFKQLPPYTIDILTFCSVEAFQDKVNLHEPVDETQVKRVLKDFGMKNMPSTIYIEHNENITPIRQKSYNAYEFIRKVVSAQAYCSQFKRNQNYKKSIGDEKTETGGK